MSSRASRSRPASAWKRPRRLRAKVDTQHAVLVALELRFLEPHGLLEVAQGFAIAPEPGQARCRALP